jgi:O-antigen/teichoic acid export membrane protein
VIVARRSVLRVSKNALARLFAQVAARLLSLVLVAMVARYESAAGLGRYVLALTVVGFAGALTDLGLNVYLTREVARESERWRQSELLGRVLPLKLGLSALGLAGLTAVALLFPLPEESRRLLVLGGFLLIPEAAMSAARAFTNGRQRMEVSGAIDVSVRLLAVAASLPLLTAGFGVVGVLAATLAAALVGVLLYSSLLWHWRTAPRWQWAPNAWRADLGQSYPFALTSIAAMVYARVDLLLLGIWRGEVAAGLYGAAYKLWEAVGLLPASLMEAMFPEMSRLTSTEDGRERLRALFRDATWGLFAVGLLLAAIGVLAAGVLVPLVFGSDGDYTPAILPFRLLVCGLPAMFLYLLSGYTLYSLDRQRRVTAAMLIAGAVNVILNLYAIPRWSYVGAAAVALLSEWLLLAILYPQARRALAEWKLTNPSSPDTEDG